MTPKTIFYYESGNQEIPFIQPDESDGIKKLRIQFTWDDIFLMCRNITYLIHESDTFFLKKIEGIIAIARGGLIPATIIAGMLGVERIESIQLRSYYNGEQKELTCFEDSLATKKWGDKDWLVIDDIYATGATYSKVRELVPNAKYMAPLVYRVNESSHPRASFSAHILFPGSMLTTEHWVVYPWERFREPEGIHKELR